MARTELVKFRVTPAEKAYIVTQAGGARQVSGHLRDLALRGYKDEGEEQQAETSEVAPLSSAVQPSTRADLPPLATEEQCPRWYHHRSGTYCGSCKTVPK